MSEHKALHAEWGKEIKKKTSLGRDTDTETTIIAIVYMFKKLKERLNMLETRKVWTRTNLTSSKIMSSKNKYIRYNELL